MEEDEKLSFNLAARYAETIGDYLAEHEHYWSRGDYKKATWALKKVWHKVGVWLKDIENSEINRKFIEIQVLMKSNKNKIQVSHKLELLGIKIGTLLNKKGLLIPKSSDPRFMFRKS